MDRSLSGERLKAQAKLNYRLKRMTVACSFPSERCLFPGPNGGRVQSLSGHQRSRTTGLARSASNLQYLAGQSW